MDDDDDESDEAYVPPPNKLGAVKVEPERESVVSNKLA